MYPKLIAISGLKGSGKDTTADMLQYCLSVPKIFRQYWMYKVFRNIVPKKYKKLAFAKPLKQMLAVLLNVPVEKFESRDFKEHYCINIPTLQIQSGELRNFTDSKFSKLSKTLDPILKESNLTIRQLLQYYGTNVIQTYFGKKVGINSVSKYGNKPTIMTDLRFIAEFEAVEDAGGIVIFADRPGLDFGTHPSESEMKELLSKFKYEYVITNDGSLKDLFNSIKELQCNLKT